MSKHIDVIAIVVIVLGVLAFSRAPQLRTLPRVNAATFEIRSAPQQVDICPLSRLLSHLR